jgi:hypothetical protein
MRSISTEGFEMPNSAATGAVPMLPIDLLKHRLSKLEFSGRARRRVYWIVVQ